MQKLSILLLAILPIITCFAVSTSIQPEASTGVGTNELVYGKNQMVVTNNPLASKAASEILAKGGNAVDAAIAASFVLGLTEPQSSGIGGGGYALTYNAKAKKIFAYDGREVAPKTANSKWFLNESGAALSFDEAMLSPKSVGVPSEVALLYKLSKDQGKLPWATLLKPAINLAANGFPMSHRLHGLLALDNDLGLFGNDMQVRVVYFDDDHVKSVGDTVINIAYANTLAQIAKNPTSFYHGEIADDIVKAINAKARNNLYSKADLASYKVERYNAICSWYRERYQICSVPPSSSGGVALLELLKIYSYNYIGRDVGDINWLYNFTEASKLAFADRNQYIADPRFVKQPVVGLLNDNYTKSRSKLVSDKALKTPVAPGVPIGIDKKYAPDNEPKNHGTTSLVVVDKDGNAVTMTVTVEHQFGSHIFVDGFFLNNELTDFSFLPANKAGRLVANRVEAKKRPRSSIAPVIVLDANNQVYMLTGSPGGSAIICYVAKNLIQVLDLGQNIASAIAYPNLCSVNGPLMIEDGTGLSSYKSKLTNMGESVITSPLVSGETSIIRADGGGWIGAADPRREGIALGN